MKRQQDIQRIHEEFKGVYITSRKGLADFFGEFYKRLYEDNER